MFILSMRSKQWHRKHISFTNSVFVNKPGRLFSDLNRSKSFSYGTCICHKWFLHRKFSQFREYLFSDGFIKTANFLLKYKIDNQWNFSMSRPNSYYSNFSANLFLWYNWTKNGSMSRFSISFIHGGILFYVDGFRQFVTQIYSTYFEMKFKIVIKCSTDIPIYNNNFKRNSSLWRMKFNTRMRTLALWIIMRRTVDQK